MRGKLVAIIALFVGAIGLFVITSLIHKKTSSTPPPTLSQLCSQFINDIQNERTQDAYNLFSTTLQKSVSYSDWQKEVPGLNSGYGDATPKYDNQTEYQNSSTTKNNTGPSIKRTYTINNYGLVYSVSCTMSQYGSIYKIDSFSSTPITTSNSGGQ